MPRRFIPTVLFAAQFLFCAYSAPPQSTASSSCPCTLQGSVVDAVSGQPVPHALVRLAAPSPRAALTDSEGKFQFEGLPAASVTLEAEKPGYLSYYLSTATPSQVFLQLAPDSPPALLKLVPESVISGQVSGENGEPLEGFTVTVLSYSPHTKRLYPDVRHRAVTDDEGKFRIAGLSPGSYILQARQNQPSAPAASGKSSVPTGYAPVLFPAANDPAAAVPLKLRPGRKFQANFSLKREPFVRLSGTVSGYGPHEQVTLLLGDYSGVPESLEIVFDAASGSFHTKWIPPGLYTLTAQSSGAPLVDSATLSAASQSPIRVVLGLGPGRMPTATYATLRVTAFSSLSNLHLVLKQGVNIPVSVRNPPSGSPAAQQTPVIQLFLTPKDMKSQSPIPFVPDEDLERPPLFSGFLGVTPGAYQLTFAVNSSSNSYYVESASWGSVDLLRDDLVLDDSASASPVEVVFQDDAANLNGSVISSGHPVSSMVVLLSDKRARTQLISAGPDGRFTFPALAPGVYRLFATESFGDFDYEDPAFLAKISSKIHEITLSTKQTASLNLELATVEE